MVHEEVGPSEANLFSGKCIIDPNQTPSTQVKPVTQLQKILKFRLATDADIQCSTAEQTKWVSLKQIFLGDSVQNLMLGFGSIQQSRNVS